MFFFFIDFCYTSTVWNTRTSFGLHCFSFSDLPSARCFCGTGWDMFFFMKININLMAELTSSVLFMSVWVIIQEEQHIRLHRAVSDLDRKLECLSLSVCIWFAMAVVSDRYCTVSRKKSLQVWLAVTLSYINRFPWFFAELLRKKPAIERCSISTPYLISAPALLAKQGTQKLDIFTNMQHAVNFVFQQDSALVHPLFCTIQRCPTAAALNSNSFVLHCGASTGQSLTPLNTRFMIPWQQH